MAYQDITFPELKLIHGMTRTRKDTTILFGNGTKEFRLKRVTYDPHSWSFPGRAVTQEDAQTLIDFYNSVNGSIDSFKFKDPDDYKWDDFTLRYHSGTAWILESNNRAPIFKLNGTITIKLGGSPYGSTGTVTVINGKPTINVIGSNSGSNVQVTGQFFYVTRFESPISYEIAALNTSNDTTATMLGDVKLKEVQEYA